MSRFGRVVAALFCLSLLIVLLSIFGLISYTTSVKSLACLKDADCPFVEDRPCVRTFCNKLAHRCEEATIVGGECSLDEQCVELYDSDFACNATTCICYQPPACLFDDDCPVSNLSCMSFYCISGECVHKTSDGAQCSLDGQCVDLFDSPFYACNTTQGACACYKKPQCTADDDCPRVDEECISYYCLNETCTEQKTIGVECSSNAECLQQFGQYYQCDLSNCSCIFAPPLQINFTCTSDANCGNSTNPCQTFKCTNGNCNQVLNPGATCSLDGICVIDNDDPFSACNLTSCDCYRRPLCVDDADCQQIYNRSCVDAVCISGHCFEQTQAGMECSMDEQCSEKNGYNTNYHCNTSATACSCYQAPQCFSDSDCVTDATRTCVASSCITGACFITLTENATCFMDAQCGERQKCNTTSCSCYNVSQCSVDSDCVNITTNPCEQSVCSGGKCYIQLATNATCSIDEMCINAFNDPFYGCNVSACQCYRKPECLVDADCPYNYALPCANFTCQSGRCALNLNAGSNCSTDAQCVTLYGFNYACNTSTTTCGCYKKAQCVTNADCPINVDHCAYVPCINGTCTQSLAPNATCISTADCVTLFNSSLYACNQTSCQCTVSPFAPGYGIAFVQGNATSSGDPITKFTMGHAQTGITEGDWLFLGNWSGGVRVANALRAGPQLWGVTFANDTFTVTMAGVWQVAIQVQGAKPTGASQLRNWMLSASKNSNTTTYNQSILPRDFSSVVGFTTNSQILTTVGVTSFVASAGDTFRIFAMETLPSGGALSDIDVYNFWVLVQKFPV